MVVMLSMPLLDFNWSMTTMIKHLVFVSYLLPWLSSPRGDFDAVPARKRTERHWGSKTFKKRKREFDEEIARRTQLNLAKREVLLEVVRRFNLHVGPGAPPSNKQCERLIATTLYANIYDLISGRYHNYRTAAALKQYSVDNEKLFSKSQAKTNPVHRLLLHKLF